MRGRGGDVLELSRRQFDALSLFVRHPGELLDKDQLLAAVWPGLVVEDNNLSQLISGLRRALGDDPQHSRYIQTVPRRGFRFVAEVRRESLATTASVDAVAATPAPTPIDAPAAETLVVATPVENTAEAESPPPVRRRALAASVAAVGVVGVGAAVFGWRIRSTPREVSAGSAATTLAVLPFKPLVMEGRNELLEVGMADSLIARLSTLPGLVVRSVGSVRRFAGPDQDPIAAAHDLDVAWVVDGSVQRWGDQVRVTARLLRASDGSAAWSGTFDEKFTGVFDVQDAISERVALVLMPRLDRGERSRLAGSGGTRQPDAYQFYLDARWQAQSVRADGLRKSVDSYGRAIAVDPGYALAYAGMAESYRRMIFGDDAEPNSVFTRALAAAERGLKIAPDLAEIHSGLGWIAFWHDWDWPRAEQIFRQAIAFNPNVVEARFGLGSLLLATGRADAGREQIQLARALDPYSLIINSLEASYLLAAGRREEGLARLQRVLALEPNFWVAHLTRADYLFADGKSDAAIDALLTADRLSDGSTVAAATLGFELGRLSRDDEARAILSRLQALERTRYVAPTSIASVQSGLRRVGAALDQLERAFELRDPRLIYLRSDGRWDALRSEPRFVALLARLRLSGRP